MKYPGETRYEITSPLFDEIDIKLDRDYAKGGSFKIKALSNSPKNIYIQSAKLNGKPYNKCYINHEALVNGGVLELQMGSQPNQS